MFLIKVAEKTKTHILYSVAFFRKSCRLLDNVENVVEPETPQMAIWRRFACWISKSTRAQAHASACVPTHKSARTHTQQYVILIAFPRQQWFRERTSMLRYIYIARLVFSVAQKPKSGLGSWISLSVSLSLTHTHPVGLF